MGVKNVGLVRSLKHIEENSNQRWNEANDYHITHHRLQAINLIGLVKVTNHLTFHRITTHPANLI